VWYSLVGTLPITLLTDSNCSATPHNDSDPATAGKLLANILSAYSPFKKFRSGKADSRVLYEVTSEFKRTTPGKNPDLKLVSFYETRLTGSWFIKRLVCVVSPHHIVEQTPY
jgi:hypothetical protein